MSDNEQQSFVQAFQAFLTQRNWSSQPTNRKLQDFVDATQVMLHNMAPPAASAGGQGTSPHNL